MRRTKIEHLSYRYMCANTTLDTMLDTMLDEKKIVLVLLNWSFNTTDMFGSHTCVCGGGGGGGGRGDTISTGGATTIYGILLYKLNI